MDSVPWQPRRHKQGLKHKHQQQHGPLAGQHHCSQSSDGSSHSRQSSASSAESGPSTRLAQVSSPTSTQESEELHTPPVLYISVFEGGAQCAVSVPSSHINMDGRNWNGDQDGYRSATPGRATPDILKQRLGSQRLGSQHLGSSADLQALTDQERAQAELDDPFAASPHTWFPADARPAHGRTLSSPLSSPTLDALRSAPLPGYQAARADPKQSGNQDMFANRSTPSPSSFPSPPSARQPTRPNRRKQSHHIPRPPTPPRKSSFMASRGSPSPPFDPFKEELTSITGAAEIAIRRRVRSSPKTPSALTRVQNGHSSPHRRSTSLGGDDLDSVYSRAWSTTKASEMDSLPRHQAPPRGPSSPLPTGLPASMRFTDAMPRRAPPPPPIVVPGHGHGQPRRPLVSPLSSNAPQRSLPAVPLSQGRSTPMTAPIVSRPFLHSPHVRAVDSNRALLHGQPVGRSVPSRGVDEDGDGDGAPADVIETLSAVREASTWDWPMPPPRHPHPLPPSAPMSARPSAASTPNAPDLDEDSYFPFEPTSDPSIHPFAYGASKRESRQSRHSDHSQDLHSSAPSSDIGPLTPNDVESPFDRPAPLKRDDRDRSERTLRSLRSERYGVPF